MSAASGHDVDERAFARMLWAYPAGWRARNGAAALGTVLDAAEHEGRSRPTMSERIDFAGHGLAQTLLDWVPPRLRDALAQAALATGFAFSVCFFWFHAREPHTLRSWSPDVYYAFGPFANPGVVVCALLIVAFALAFTPWRAALRATLGTAVAVAALLPVASVIVPGWDRPSTTSILFFALLGLLALAGQTFSKRVMGLGAGAAAGLLIWFEAQHAESWGLAADRQFWHGVFGPGWLGLVPAIALALAGILALVRYRSGALTVTAFALPWLPMTLLLAIARDGDAGPALALVATSVGALLLTLRWLGVRVTRTVEPAPDIG